MHIGCWSFQIELCRMKLTPLLHIIEFYAQFKSSYSKYFDNMIVIELLGLWIVTDFIASYVSIKGLN